MPLIRTDAPALAALAKDFAWGQKFVVWVGSGLSIPAGLPSWPQLRIKLEARLRATASRKLVGLSEQQTNEFLSQLRRLPDPWEAFQILKSRLGDADYRQVLMIALNDDAVSSPPGQLDRIWRSPNTRGIISLNIDNLASRSFARVNQGRRELARATGTSLNLALKYLSEYQPFLIQLHGRFDDDSSWIFTSSELTNLFSSESYKTFVRATIASGRIIFIGCSPDDPAVARHFAELRDFATNMPHHYWFVPSFQVDRAREFALGDLGITLVEYDVDSDLGPIEQNRQHEASLNELFDYLETYQFTDPDPDPINPMAGPAGARLPPERVQALSPEQARNVLSRYATAILESGMPSRITEYETFLEQYGTAIAVASHVSRTPGSQLFGHKIINAIGEGAFSRVFFAKAPDGRTEHAIKLVRNEVRDDPVMLRSFRRGVKSMQILSQKGIEGMVSYSQAFEIPPCVIMPYVDGENLEVAGSQAAFSFLKQGLPILARIADIVGEAHDLPERVLHRDIRPANIILRKGGGGSSLDHQVVVLDFDLSWHEGADADSPISPSMTTVLGYLAPEQIAADLTVSARHSKVDSYGLCMTMFYLLQKQHPDFSLRPSGQWDELRSKLGQSLSHQIKWKSLLPRVRRLIHFGTHPRQVDRVEYELVRRELALLRDLAECSLDIVKPAISSTLPLEALAEEIFCSALASDSYTWSSGDGGGEYVAPMGICISLSITESSGMRGLHMSAAKPNDGTHSFSTVKKYWGERQAEINGILNAAGWTRDTSRSRNSQELGFDFFIDEAAVWARPSTVRKSIENAWRKLSMA